MKINMTSIQKKIDDYTPDYLKNIKYGKENEDYVVCAICGEKKGTLTQHLRKVHCMTKEEYISKYNAPVSSNKNKLAYHNCALSKWKTQFDSGYSKHFIKNNKLSKEKSFNISKEQIYNCLKEGMNQQQMDKYFNFSDTTLRKIMKQCNIEMPSRTILSIRKAVKNGSELNLELVSKEDIYNMIATEGKQKTMQRFGVKRTVFDTWIKSNFILSEIPDGLSNEQIISFFRKFGFPYSKIENFDVNKIVKSIISCKNMIDENNNINIGASFGNDILLSFFPHFFDCYQNGRHSARWYFENKLQHILNDIRKYYHKYPTISSVRACLMQHERITGFRPVIVKQIYDKYCNENSIVLDPCGGWGGRMLGAYCSNKVKQYDCMEASLNSYNSLNNVKKYFNKLFDNKIVNVSYGCYEESNYNNDYYDVIFTSTSYFCKEFYSNDNIQSCNKYNNYQGWKNGFLYKFVQKSYNYLKDNGYFIVNIDDVTIKGIKYELTKDLCFIADKTGFKLKEKLFMKSRNRYTNINNGEFIFLFIK